MTWLSELANVARAAGLVVVEVPGWERRSRGNGASYAPGRPTHVMVHHTASPPGSDGARDVDYICHGAAAAPLANLYLDRAGAVHVCAAGPTNTNGKGSSRPWAGGVPDDLMNAYAIGIEAANTGTGEVWPTPQTNALVTLCRALCITYGITFEHVRAHHEWAPSRKIDPAGPSPWATSGSWNMDAFRATLAAQPIPPTGETDMAVSAYIAVPPRPSREGHPWLVVVDGNVRPATELDTTNPALPWYGMPDNADAVGQYDALARAAGLD